MLRVVRKGKKEIVCTKVVFRKSFFRKATGLMFHKKIRNEAHVFVFKEKRKIDLTMWFVFFPIDVVFLDEKKRIVEIKENFRPFTNYYPKKESFFVVELPQGTIKRKKLKINDLLEF
ncbi:MAG: DUF192 domain-containing protein [Candidatus Nanoarchaeia archaeon]